eukprot:CAMPEP_0172902184 /NCGR_PEP_ID=MMETSP1075-20121228/167886_1 /TAXON_ID=2916 /ORGANISM="Ceratium fusus, Strain PA161109" /LENGTH=41 /DNA_ID= /DNA_START= /DNA_END= /DNA_ORIENTATION=
MTGASQMRVCSLSSLASLAQVAPCPRLDPVALHSEEFLQTH